MFDQSRFRTRGSRPRLAACAVLLALILAMGGSDAALAQTASSPTKAQYGSRSQQISAGTDQSSGQGHGIGGLPFTGLDVGILAASAATLLGAGVALRRLSGPGRGSPRGK